MNNFKKSYLAPILFYLILNIIIFLPIFFGKVNLNGNLLISSYSLYGKLLPTKPTGYDQIRFFYPNLGFTQDQIKNSQIPLWNPYIFSGHPHFAAFQTAVFYPLNLFSPFVSQITLWHIFRFSPYTLAAFFTFLYLKNLKLKPIAAFFGGLTFGFSSLLIDWGEEIIILPHSIMWLPLLLLLVDKYLQSKKKVYLGLITTATSLSILSGFIQTTIYILIFTIAYFCFRAKTTRNFHFHLFAYFVFSQAAAFLVASIQILPSMELFSLSARSSFLPQLLFKFLIPANQLITFLAPDFFGHPATFNLIGGKGSLYYEAIIFFGVGALIFALSSIFYLKKNRMIKFYLATALVTLFLTLDLTITKLQFFIHIPFLSTSIPNRILFLTTFSLSALSAIGVDLFLKTRKSTTNKAILIIGTVYFIITLNLLATIVFKIPYYGEKSVNALISLRNLVVPLSIFSVSSLTLILARTNIKFKKASVILIILISAIYTVSSSYKYLTFTEKNLVYPKLDSLDFIGKNQGLDRTWALTQDRLFTNIFLQYRIYYPEGYDPANIKKYLQLTTYLRAPTGSLLERTVAELGIKADISDILKDETHMRLLNMLGVKYLLVDKNDESKIPNNFKKVYEDSQESGFAVYENPNVLPRTYLASQIVSVSTADKNELEPVFNFLKDPNFDYKNSVVLQNSDVKLDSKDNEGQATITSYKPKEVKIKTNSKEPKILVLTDNNYPGWSVKVDDKNYPVLTANYAFKAVSLGPGSHIVKFYYQNNLFIIGSIISLATLLFTYLVYFTSVFDKLIKILKFF